MEILHSPQFGVFLLAALVLACTPGSGLAYVVARTVAGGWREGVASSLGTAVGGAGHVVAAAFGLSLLLAQSAIAFTLVKYAGACYLVYLGLRLLLSRTGNEPGPTMPAVGRFRAVRDGVLVELFNVKTALFFVSFIPQFIDPGYPATGQIVLLGATCVALNTCADLLAVAGASRLLQSSASRRLRARLFTMGSGVTLVALGVHVALARHER